MVPRDPWAPTLNRLSSQTPYPMLNYKRVIWLKNKTEEMYVLVDYKTNTENKKIVGYTNLKHFCVHTGVQSV